MIPVHTNPVNMVFQHPVADAVQYTGSLHGFWEIEFQHQLNAVLVDVVGKTHRQVTAFPAAGGGLLGRGAAAGVIGKIAEKDRSVPRLLLACFAGLAVLYLVGLPYIALIVNVYKGGNVSGMTLATAYMLPYLPGDCLKIVVSVILAPRILKAMERNS